MMAQGEMNSIQSSESHISLSSLRDLNIINHCHSNYSTSNAQSLLLQGDLEEGRAAAPLPSRNKKVTANMDRASPTTAASADEKCRRVDPKWAFHQWNGGAQRPEWVLLKKELLEVHG